jgi:hypothetical protein
MKQRVKNDPMAIPIIAPGDNVTIDPPPHVVYEEEYTSELNT